MIPARGGSKRVPGKNVRPLCGLPLLSYTVGAALRSEVFEKVIVSTDSPEIARLARDSGADVPFLRDPGLSDDFTPASRVTLDALLRADPAATRFRTSCSCSRSTGSRGW